MNNLRKTHAVVMTAFATVLASTILIGIKTAYADTWTEFSQCFVDGNGKKCPQPEDCQYVLQIPYYCNNNHLPTKCTGPYPKSDCRIDPIATTCGNKVSCFDDIPIGDESGGPIACDEKIVNCVGRYHP